MKLLRRFCSEQVQILLERMDDHWEEEFDIYESKWEPMLPQGKAFFQYTWVERRCISFTAGKQEVKLKKKRAYIGILERTISPAKTRWDFDHEQKGELNINKGGTGFTQPTHMLTGSTMQSQLEVMLNNQYHQNLRQEIQKSMLQGIPQ